MYQHIVYLSSAVSLFSSENLQELLEKSRIRNKELRITGLLLYKDKSFIQMIEGSEQATNDLYRIIKDDKRHFNVRLLDKTRKAQRTFKEWHMGFFDLDGEAQHLDGYLNCYSPGFRFDDFINAPDKAIELLMYFRARS